MMWVFHEPDRHFVPRLLLRKMLFIHAWPAPRARSTDSCQARTGGGSPLSLGRGRRATGRVPSLGHAKVGSAVVIQASGLVEIARLHVLDRAPELMAVVNCPQKHSRHMCCLFVYSAVPPLLALHLSSNTIQMGRLRHLQQKHLLIWKMQLQKGWELARSFGMEIGPKLLAGWLKLSHLLFQRMR